jgi:hypothetical protein
MTYRLVGRRPAAPPGLCPLCTARDDTVGHILAACSKLKNLHIQRHDKTGRKIIDFVRHGKLGACYIMADVGNKATLAELQVQHKRVWDWLLPNDKDLGNYSRPDIVVAHLPCQADVQNSPKPAAGTILTLIEIGYRSDFDVEGKKLDEKREQHRALEKALADAGYQVNYQVWDIGYTGVMSDRLLGYAKDLGIEKPKQVITSNTPNSNRTCLNYRKS